MRKVRGITSPSFSDTCFTFAVTVFTNGRENTQISYKEVAQLLYLMHPDHPFSFMKFLFKLHQSDDKTVRLKDLEVVLKAINSGHLYEVSLLLRSSLDYIYEKQKNPQVRFSTEGKSNLTLIGPIIL